MTRMIQMNQCKRSWVMIIHEANRRKLSVNFYSHRREPQLDEGDSEDKNWKGASNDDSPSTALCPGKRGLTHESDDLDEPMQKKAWYILPHSNKKQLPLTFYNRDRAPDFKWIKLTIYSNSSVDGSDDENSNTDKGKRLMQLNWENKDWCMSLMIQMNQL